MAFVNFSNHRLNTWSSEQKEAATELGGELIDMQFPNVAPEATSEELKAQAESFASEIAGKATVAMVMGEFCLAHYTTECLLRKGVKVVVSTSRREAVDVLNADGSVSKNSIFRFVGFRKI